MKLTWHNDMSQGLRIAAILLLCSTSGLTIGSIVAYQMTERRLDRYAEHLVQFSENYTDEIVATLDAVNSSPFPFCSDDDLARLRSLVFHGHLVKEIGRVHDSMLYCTSESGRFDHPVPETKPDITLHSGRTVWLHSPLVTVPGMYGDITQSGQATFVSAQNLFGNLREEPMTYTTTLTDRSIGKVWQTAGDPLKLTSAEVLSEKEVLRGNALYLSRCSAQYAPCMVVGISLRDAWQNNTPLIAGFVLIGCLTGVVIALMIMMQPHNRGLVSQLRRALRRNLITVVYQPIVDVRTGRMVGAEALARWTDEDGQYIPPDVFVAAAEELGFVGKLTRVVLRLIADEMGDFLRENPGFHVNVNIAAADLADPQFLPMMEKLLRKYDIPSKSIGLELTERSTADHQLTIPAIGKLRERGHEFYIDDFGTGYSSLSYLNELAVDGIKIDRSFTDAVGTDSLTATIVPQILAMANSLKIKVVVEGVESAEQSEYFVRLDQMILAQGWHFGQPIPAHQLLDLIAIKSTENLSV